jgi:hypothetical protein
VTVSEALNIGVKRRGTTSIDRKHLATRTPHQREEIAAYRAHVRVENGKRTTRR